MAKLFTNSELEIETRKYRNTGGASQGNGGYGFIPAFKDSADGAIYLSRTAGGELAKLHILDGLPQHLIVAKEHDRVTAVKETLVAGFVLKDCFFTRDEAASHVSIQMSKTA